AICPNCGYKLRNLEPGDPAFAPFVRYGDRILVLKYLYLFEEPKRWDVVVFKSPDGPAKNDYTQNYIKRLVGKPNESVVVLDGDVSTGPRDAKPKKVTTQTKPPQVQEALWRLVYDNDYCPRRLDRGGGVRWVQPWTPRQGHRGWDLGTDAS